MEPYVIIGSLGIIAFIVFAIYEIETRPDR